MNKPVSKKTGFTLNALKVGMGVAFVSSTLAAPLASASDNPFVANDLGSGYQLADKHGEGKCGEGKCGEGKDAAKDKEGKCGEGKCGEGKDAAKDKKGKCGEGECGEGKGAKDAEGKCGG